MVEKEQEYEEAVMARVADRYTYTCTVYIVDTVHAHAHNYAIMYIYAYYNPSHTTILPSLPLPPSIPSIPSSLPPFHIPDQKS